MPFIDYFVAEADSADGLSMLVMARMKAGYMPIGGVAVAVRRVKKPRVNELTAIYSQAMLLPSQKMEEAINRESE